MIACERSGGRKGGREEGREEGWEIEREREREREGGREREKGGGRYRERERDGETDRDGDRELGAEKERPFREFSALFSSSVCLDGEKESGSKVRLKRFPQMCSCHEKRESVAVALFVCLWVRRLVGMGAHCDHIALNRVSCGESSQYCFAAKKHEAIKAEQNISCSEAPTSFRSRTHVMNRDLI